MNISRVLRALLASILAISLGACASMTPTQKTVVSVLVAGTAVAMIKANSSSPSFTTTSAQQFPCGCSPPPAVK